MVFGQRTKKDGGKDEYWASGLDSGSRWLPVYQFWKLKGELGFGGRTVSSVFDILGLQGWQCLPRGIRLLTESIRSSFSVNEVISLPGTNGDLHWESKEFGLEYVRGTNLKLKSGYTVTRFSF